MRVRRWHCPDWRRHMIKPAIVIVDDIPQVLHQLESDLEKKYSGHFRIIEADSGQQALNQLKQMSLHNEPVALLLVDEQMPVMSGSVLLKEACELYPKAKRILLITYADTRAAIQQINSGQIDYYLMKPWEPRRSASTLRWMIYWRNGWSRPLCSRN